MFRNIDRTNEQGLCGGGSRRANRRAGFTLTEVMMATVISALVSAGLLSFYLTSYKIGFVNQERNRINADMRSLTGQLLQDGRQANYFKIYKSVGETDRDTASDRVMDGGSGDMLAFVYTVDGGSPMAPDKVSRIVCYFRDATTAKDGLAPVRRYERSFEPATEDSLESLLPSGTSLALADEVLELSRGLANGHLFYNFWGRSVMVNGQIVHGNDAKRVTETYNFTISPRG